LNKMRASLLMPRCPSPSKTPAKRQHLQRLPTRLQSEITSCNSSLQPSIASLQDTITG
jgi:hypothetical protein